jgi:hypothetical protein
MTHVIDDTVIDDGSVDDTYVADDEYVDDGTNYEEDAKGGSIRTNVMRRFDDGGYTGLVTAKTLVTLTLAKKFKIFRTSATTMVSLTTHQ